MSFMLQPKESKDFGVDVLCPRNTFSGLVGFPLAFLTVKMSFLIPPPQARKTSSPSATNETAFDRTLARPTGKRCFLVWQEEDEGQSQDTYSFPSTAYSAGNSRQREVPLVCNFSWSGNNAPNTRGIWNISRLRKSNTCILLFF